MKLPRTQIILALVLTGGVGAFAQANKNIPGPQDYAKFSQFVADRNIFDPNRTPRYYSSGTVRPIKRPKASPSTPAFTLVGTMHYEKGMFAFFSGNDADLKKILTVSQQIAGYTVTEVELGRAQLETADKKQKLELKVGDVVRQENGSWQHSGATEVPAGAEASAVSTENPGEGAAPSAPASASEPNEILKRLMQLREQESK